jgi:hypothetical protein
MKDRFHQRAVESRSRVKGGNGVTRRSHEGTESCIAYHGRVELNAAVNPWVNTKDRLALTPGENRRFEFARGRFDERS